MRHKFRAAANLPAEPLNKGVGSATPRVLTAMSTYPLFISPSLARASFLSTVYARKRCCGYMKHERHSRCFSTSMRRSRCTALYTSLPASRARCLAPSCKTRLAARSMSYRLMRMPSLKRRGLCSRADSGLRDSTSPATAHAPAPHARAPRRDPPACIAPAPHSGIEPAGDWVS